MIKDNNKNKANIKIFNQIIISSNLNKSKQH